MSPETIRFLLGLLDGLTLNAGAPDFEDAFQNIVKARRELQAQLPADDS